MVRESSKTAATASASTTTVVEVATEAAAASTKIGEDSVVVAVAAVDIMIEASRTTVSVEEVAATSAAGATPASVVVAEWLTGARTDTRTIVAASAAEAVAMIGMMTKAIVAKRGTTELLVASLI